MDACGRIAAASGLRNWRPRQDSNLRTRLRRPALYPTELRGPSYILDRRLTPSKTRPSACLPPGRLTASGSSAILQLSLPTGRQAPRMATVEGGIRGKLQRLEALCQEMLAHRRLIIASN